MGSPKHQHFIPRSYLKNFAEVKDEVHWVDTLMRGKGEGVKQLTISNIAVQKNLYTFPLNTEGDRYALEKFYAVEVDGQYPSVYSLLTNKNITVIDEDDKRKILNTLLSLLFRTPRFLNFQTESLDEIFDKIAAEVTDPEQDINIGFQGSTFHFKRKDLETTREEKMKGLKQQFLISHFADWQDFVKYKMQCGIEVIEVGEESPIITSDSPVVVMDLMGNLNLTNVFHPENIIELPLNRTTYCIIFPNAVAEKGDALRITRSKRDRYFAAGVNLSVTKGSYNRLISYPGDLKLNSDLQRELGAWNTENVDAFEKLKQKTGMAMELMNLIRKKGTAIDPEVAALVTAIRKTGKMDDDETFKKLIHALARNGYLTV